MRRSQARPRRRSPPCPRAPTSDTSRRWRRSPLPAARWTAGAEREPSRSGVRPLHAVEPEGGGSRVPRAPAADTREPPGRSTRSAHPRRPRPPRNASFAKRRSIALMSLNRESRLKIVATLRLFASRWSGPSPACWAATATCSASAIASSAMPRASRTRARMRSARAAMERLRAAGSCGRPSS